jgi:tetratricopeptide (TPR) repeat protein
MRIILLTVLLYFLVCKAHSQQRSNPDSLLKVLPATSGKEKVMVLQELTLAWLGIDKDKTLLYAEQALKEAEEIKNDSLTIATLNYLIAAKENYGDYRACLPLSERSVEIARRTGDKKQLITAIGHLAIDYYQTFQLDKVLTTAVEGLELAKELKDTVGMAHMYEMHAQTYQRLKNYDQAEKYFKEEIELIKKTNRQFELGRAFINIGVNYAMAKKYPQAIESYEQGLVPFKRSTI